MKNVLTCLVLIGSALTFLIAPRSAQSAPDTIPPIAQPLVREGDFALKLAPMLLPSAPDDELAAEDALLSVGVVPSNGWIADYPVTPVVLGDLRIAVATAADAGLLTKPRAAAVKALYDEASTLALDIQGASDTSESNPPDDARQYPDQTWIDNYYEVEGPPVVSYYAPPSDYYALYDWVAYPFWCGGSYFPGFFILTDFDRVVHHHRGDMDDLQHVSNRKFGNDDHESLTVLRGNRPRISPPGLAGGRGAQAAAQNRNGEIMQSVDSGSGVPAAGSPGPESVPLPRQIHGRRDPVQAFTHSQQLDRNENRVDTGFTEGFTHGGGFGGKDEGDLDGRFGGGAHVGGFGGGHGAGFGGGGRK